MQYTDNLNLNKPETTDFYDIEDFNDNADTIDAVVKEAQDDIISLNNDLAQLSGSISDEYDPDTIYAPDDPDKPAYCINNNILWKNKVQCQGVTPEEGIYWEATTVSEELKQLRLQPSGGSGNNENLFHNPMFNVNQRNFNTTSQRTAGYGFDRWNGTYRYNTLWKAPELSDKEFLIQILDTELLNFLDGKTVTASVKFADQSIVHATFVFDKDTPSIIGYLVDRGTISQHGDAVAFTCTRPDIPVTVIAMKLELGSESTLDSDVPQNVGLETLKCSSSRADTADPYTHIPYKPIAIQSTAPSESALWIY